MPELGGDDPLLAVARDRIADKRFGRVIAVALGGGDEVDANLARSVEDGVDFGLGEILPPLPPELPGADPDDGKVEVGLAEATVSHRRSLPMRLSDMNHSKWRVANIEVPRTEQVQAV